MNTLLEKAIAEITKLPESEQEAFAAWVLEELASERRWDEVFAKSADILALLADEALAEHRMGKPSYATRMIYDFSYYRAI